MCAHLFPWDARIFHTQTRRGSPEKLSEQTDEHPVSAGDFLRPFAATTVPAFGLLNPDAGFVRISAVMVCALQSRSCCRLSNIFDGCPR
jgi:hypothetical protein